MASSFGYSDTTIGLRYRFLTEDSSFTLTAGPQLILPTGSLRDDTGKGSIGVAWDVAAAKDWGGPLFLISSLNYGAFPSVDDIVAGSTGEFNLQRINWATAIGIRALERPRNGAKHDIHAFLEAGGAWEQELEGELSGSLRHGKLSWILSPGARYGFLTSGKTLIEVGVALPVALGPNGPKKGIIVQLQFERFLTQ